MMGCIRNISNKCWSVWALSGVILAVFSALVKWVIVPIVVKEVVWDIMKLKGGTLGFEVWELPPVPVFMKFYLFNIENPDVIKNGGRARVREIGPFVYREIRQKQNLKRLNDEITYGMNVIYTFEKDLSCDECSPSTIVTVPNIALLSAVGIIESLPNITIPGIGNPASMILELINNEISSGIYEDELFHQVTADEILFSGYTPPVLKFFLDLWDELSFLGPLLPPLPDMLASGKFGLWYGMNNTMENQYYTIDTGDKIKDKYASVKRYNGEEKLPSQYWSHFGPTPSVHKAGYGGDCLEIHGTDGQQFHPLLQDQDHVWLFTPDLCRSIKIYYIEDVMVNGIRTRHFENLPEVFNLTLPENLCYCTNVATCAVETPGEDKWDTSECHSCKLGLINSQGCKGAPAYGGSPHFYNADPKLSQAIDGLNPNHDDHGTFLNIEPYSGVSFQAHKRIQAAFHMMSVEEIGLLKNVPDVYLPVMWYDEGAEIDQKWSRKFKNIVQVPFLLVDIFSYSGMVIGAILFIGSVIGLLR